VDGADPDRWDPAKWDEQHAAAASPTTRPNRDALGQSLRAACGVLLATLVVLSVALVPQVDRAVRITVGYVVLPLFLAAVFVALVAWSSPSAWTPRRYLLAVTAFGAVTVAVVAAATRAAT
jgi:hypothetical protein